MSGVGRYAYGRLTEGACRPPLMRKGEGQQAKVYTPKASRPTYLSPPKRYSGGSSAEQGGGGHPSKDGKSSPGPPRHLYRHKEGEEGGKTKTETQFELRWQLANMAT